MAPVESRAVSKKNYHILLRGLLLCEKEMHSLEKEILVWWGELIKTPLQQFTVC